MMHKYTFELKKRKKGFLGISYTVTEKRTVEVDGKTYKKLKEQDARRKKNTRTGKYDYTVEEMLFYDELFGD